MVSPRRRVLEPVTLPLVAVVLLAGCGGGTPSSSSSSSSSSSPSSSSGHRAAYLDRVRDAVVRGAATDFALGTGIGGPSFAACVEKGLREALDRSAIGNLVVVYRRPYGTAHAAQALNALAAPFAASCGHRHWMPELVEAARGLRSAAPIGLAIEKLGVTYGPYLGMRCRRAGYGRCERVGIDVVFGRAATSVEATLGLRTIRLGTPGLHDGTEYRDWVGTFTGADLPPRRRHRDQDLVYVPVELRVRFADGRRVQTRFPHVLVSSGWG